MGTVGCEHGEVFIGTPTERNHMMYEVECPTCGTGMDIAPEMVQGVEPALMVAQIEHVFGDGTGQVIYAYLKQRIEDDDIGANAG